MFPTELTELMKFLLEKMMCNVSKQLIFNLNKLINPMSYNYLNKAHICTIVQPESSNVYFFYRLIVLSFIDRFLDFFSLWHSAYRSVRVISPLQSDFFCQFIDLNLKNVNWTSCPFLLLTHTHTHTHTHTDKDARSPISQF